jgi:hypothetical protein
MTDRVYGTIEVVDECGRTHPCPITNMYDILGNDTDILAEAASIVIQLPNGQWAAVEADHDAMHRLH